jgi:hypothetical protein
MSNGSSVDMSLSEEIGLNRSNAIPSLIRIQLILYEYWSNARYLNNAEKICLKRMM